MANGDNKKTNSKPKPKPRSSSTGSGGGSGNGGGGGDGYMDFFFWALIIAGAYVMIKYLFGLLNFGDGFGLSLSRLIASIYGYGQIVSIFLSMLFLLGIIYTKYKVYNMHHHHWNEIIGKHPSHTQEHPISTEAGVKNKRWENVSRRISSQNESDWRLAILECDIILNEMLDKMGYKGEGVAEKLKQVEKSDFDTLDHAWRAHKIRNEIAHRGSEFHLTRPEAEGTFNLYKKVFEEFHYI